MRLMSKLIAAAAATLLLEAAPAWADETSAAASNPTTAPQADKPDAPTIACTTETGSRIKRRKGSCNSSPGRVFQAEELQSTGQSSIGDALRRVDPGSAASPGR